MKKYVVNYDCMANSDLAIFTAKEIVKSLNDGNYTVLDTAIEEAVDRTLTYYDDQWELMKIYQRPKEANYDEAEELFVQELYSIIDEEELEE